MAATTNNNDKSSSSSIRILALHGSEGSATQFASVVTQLGATATHTNPTWDIHSVNAPFVKGDGYAWWLNPPGVRSYTATEYPGIDKSIQAVHDKVRTSCAEHHVDLIVAHSQGAILTTAMLALQPQGILQSNSNNNKKNHYHPRLGYILNGGAWPNPYTAQMESLQLESDKVRILCVTGKADRINPPDTQQRVSHALQAAGASVTTVTHEGGHGVPVAQDDPAVQEILQWIAQGMNNADNDETN